MPKSKGGEKFARKFAKFALITKRLHVDNWNAWRRYEGSGLGTLFYTENGRTSRLAKIPEFALTVISSRNHQRYVSRTVNVAQASKENLYFGLASGFPFFLSQSS